jgi:hypothetical protein
MVKYKQEIPDDTQEAVKRTNFFLRKIPLSSTVHDDILKLSSA